MFSVRDDLSIVKLKCKNQQKETYHQPGFLTSFGGNDLNILFDCDNNTGSNSNIGDSYECPEGVVYDSE